MWAVSRYDDVVFLLKSPQVFSSEGFGLAFQPEWLGSTRNPLAHSVLTKDPPVHTKLRALAGRAFSSTPFKVMDVAPCRVGQQER